MKRTSASWPRSWWSSRVGVAVAQHGTVSRPDHFLVRNDLRTVSIFGGSGCSWLSKAGQDLTRSCKGFAPAETCHDLSSLIACSGACTGTNSTEFCVKKVVVESKREIGTAAVPRHSFEARFDRVSCFGDVVGRTRAAGSSTGCS